LKNNCVLPDARVSSRIFSTTGGASISDVVSDSTALNPTSRSAAPAQNRSGPSLPPGTGIDGLCGVVVGGGGGGVM
jgi:hypothetical protein